MSDVIGQLIPLAVGIAISPIPIIAVILMLFAPRAGGTSFGFLIGWVAGIAIGAGVFTILAGSLDSSSGDPSPTVGWIRIGLGALLLILGIKEWRGRPRKGEEPEMPKWMSAIDGFTPVKAGGMGFALSALNPKNLMMCVAAGAAIGPAGLGTGDELLALAVFTVIAASTVAVPVIGYAVAADRLKMPLERLREWLGRENATVMAVLLVVLGATLIWKGMGQ